MSVCGVAGGAVCSWEEDPWAMGKHGFVTLRDIAVSVPYLLTEGQDLGQR